jgi:hypothetical protein
MGYRPSMRTGGEREKTPSTDCKSVIPRFNPGGTSKAAPGAGDRAFLFSDAAHAEFRAADAPTVTLPTTTP